MVVLRAYERLIDLLPMENSELCCSGSVHLEGRCWPFCRFWRRNGKVADIDQDSDEQIILNMRAQEMVRGYSTNEKRSQGFVFINTNSIVLGRKTRLVTFDLKDIKIATTHFDYYGLKRFDVGDGFDNRYSVNHAVETIRDNLADDITHQNFSVIMESIIKLKTAAVQAAVFSIRGVKKDHVEEFVVSASQFIFRSESTRTYFVNTITFMDPQGFDKLCWTIMDEVCICQRLADTDAMNFSCGTVRGIFMYRCNILNEYDAYIPVDEFTFRHSHTFIECASLILLDRDLFKEGIAENIRQKYIADIIDVDPSYTNMTLSGLGAHIKCTAPDACMFISLRVSRCFHSVRGANGNENVCVCRRESGEEHRFEWKIKANGDFIIMLYNVQRPAPESSNGDVTPRNDSQ